MSADVHDLASLRSELEHQLATHQARFRRLDDHRHNRDGLPSQDWEDRATEQENDEIVDRLEPMTRREIEALEAALARLDAGVAFTCQRCGDAIHPRRVAMLPATPFCADCAN